MPVPTLISELSTTIASNSPAGSESPASLDDYQRAHAAFIAQLHANTVAAPTVIVASATSTAIGAAASENVDISGTTTITGFGTIAEGINRKGRFTGILTLTHNATSLILPGAANITTAPDDRYEARSLGAGNWIVTKYERANGGAINTTFKVGPEAMPAWPSTWRGVDVGAQNSIVEGSSGVSYIVNNLWYDGTSWRYRGTTNATIIESALGRIRFLNAPSGTADTVATVTERLSVSDTGVVTFNSKIARHDGNTVHGRLFGDGKTARLPAGWTSVRASLGLYTITHNLNTKTYTVIPGTEENFAVARAQIFNKGLNDFQIGTTSGTNAASTDMISTFIMMMD